MNVKLRMKNFIVAAFIATLVVVCLVCALALTGQSPTLAEAETGVIGAAEGEPFAANLTYNFDAANQTYKASGLIASDPDNTANSSNLKVVIPSVYNTELNGEHPVTEIEANAFNAANTGGFTITALDLSGASNLTRIGDGAFSNAKLKAVSLSDKIEVIGAEAFLNCTDARGDLVTPKSVKVIGTNAFNGSKFDGQLVFETEGGVSGLAEIGIGAFANGNFGNGIGVDGGAPLNLIIPDSVTTIGDSAFLAFGKTADPSIRGRLQLSSRLTVINASVFKDATFQGDLVIPENVRELGESAFQASTFNKVTFAENGALKTIGKKAFCLAAIRGDLVLPDSVTSIGANAFEQYGDVPTGAVPGNLKLSAGLFTIGEFAFYKAKLSGVLSIPESVETIEASAFRTTNFTSLVFSRDSRLTTIGNNAFNGSKSFTGDLTLPDSITSIGDAAFLLSTFDGQLKLPNNAEFTTINADTFSGVPLSGVLTLPARVTTVLSDAFDGTHFEGILDIPYVTTMGVGAFGYMPNIQNVLLPDAANIANYDKNAFTSNLLNKDMPLICKSAADYEIYKSNSFDRYKGLTYETTVQFKQSTANQDQLKLFNQVFGYFKDDATQIWSIDSAYEFPAITQEFPSYWVAYWRFDDSAEGEGYLTSTELLVVKEGITAVPVNKFNGAWANGGISGVPFYTITGLNSLYIKLLKPEQKTAIAIEIPSVFSSSIELNEHVVKEIDNNAFYVSGIPGVTPRADYADLTFTSLNLQGASNLTTIGAYAFTGWANCTDQIILPESVTSIGSFCFAYGSFSGELKITKNIGSIGSASAGAAGDSIGSAFKATKITSVVFEDGAPNLTAIPQQTFYLCRDLGGNILIPGQISSIGDSAFRDTAIESLTIAESETDLSIGVYAFYSTKISGELFIPARVTTISSSAFGGNAKITKLTFGQGSKLTTIGNGAFSDTKLEGVITFPDTLSSIGNDVFSGQQTLGNVHAIYLPNNTSGTTYGAGIFGGELSTSLVIIAPTKAAYDTLSKGALSDCSSKLAYIAKITMQGNGGKFLQAPNIDATQIIITTLRGTGFNFKWRMGEDKIWTLDENYTFPVVGQQSFKFVEWNTLQNGQGSAVKEDTDTLFADSVSVYAQYTPTVFSSTYRNDYGDRYYIITGYNSAYIDTLDVTKRNGMSLDIPAVFDDGINGELPVKEIGENAFKYINSVTKYKVITFKIHNATNLEKIGKDAFRDLFRLTGKVDKIVMPASLRIIGESAFMQDKNASALEFAGLELNDGLQKISEAAFRYTNIKGNISIPDTVTSIGAYAFADSKFDGTLKLPDNSGFTVIITGAFQNLKFSGNITVPRYVKSIGKDAFAGTTSVGNLQFGNLLAAIETGAFDGATFTGATDLVLPASLTALNTNAFRGIKGYTGSLTILGDLEVIGPEAFKGASFTGSLTLPTTSRFETIFESAFEGCQFVGEVSIRAKDIRDYAFKSCFGITSITMTDKVQKIGKEAFLGCGALTKITGFSQAVTTIGEKAFYNCQQLAGAITLPSTLTKLDNNAFDMCVKLQTVYINAPTSATFGSNIFNACRAALLIFANKSAYDTLAANAEGKFYKYLDKSTFEVEAFDVTIGSPLQDADKIKLAGFKLGYVKNPQTLVWSEDASYTLPTSTHAFYLHVGWTDTATNAEAAATKEAIVSLEGRNFVARWNGIYEIEKVEGNAKIKGFTAEYLETFADNANITMVIPGEYTDKLWHEHQTIYRVTEILKDAFAQNITGKKKFKIDFLDMSQAAYLQTIGQSAFADCTIRGNLIFPNGLLTIGDSAFAYTGSDDRGAYVQIPATVTAIGNAAFRNTRFSGNLRLDGALDGTSQLNSIGSEAFWESDFTGSLRLPDTLVTLGSYAFYAAQGFTGTLTLPKNPNFSTIEKSAFCATNFTGELIIPDSVSIIKENAFALCQYITKLTFSKNPNLEVEIGNMAFGFLIGLDGVLSLPDNIVKIGTDAFKDLTKIDTMYLPNNVRTEYSKEMLTGGGIFEGGEYPLIVSEEVYNTIIGDAGHHLNLDMYKDRLSYEITTKINAEANGGTVDGIVGSIERLALFNLAYSYEKDEESEIWSKDVYRLPEAAIKDGWRFTGWYSLKEGEETPVTNETLLTEEFIEIFARFAILEFETQYDESTGEYTIIKFADVYIDYIKASEQNNLNLTIPATYRDVTRREGNVVEISDSAFGKSNYTNYPELKIASVDLSSAVNLRKIGQFAFENHDTLRTVTFCENGVLSEIGTGAFKIGGMSSLILPASLETIGTQAFFRCLNLSNLTFAGADDGTSKLANIGEEAFAECVGIGADGANSNGVFELKFPDSVKSIGKGAFRNTATGGVSVKNIVFGNGLQTIGEKAFRESGFGGILIIPASVTKVESQAFYGCVALTGIQLPETEVEYGNNVFYNCFNLTGTLTLPDAMTVIPIGMFFQTNYSEVIIPAAVTQIGDSAFKFMPNLTRVFINGAGDSTSSLKAIGLGAFEGCHVLSEIILPEGLERIGENAFFDCRELQGVLKIPDSVVSIDNSAFYGTGYETIYLPLNDATEYGVSVFGLEFWCYVPIVAPTAELFNKFKASEHSLSDYRMLTFETKVTFDPVDGNIVRGEAEMLKLVGGELKYEKDYDGRWAPNDEFMLPVARLSGNIFDGWRIDTGETVKVSTIVTENAVYTADYDVIQYEVTYDPNHGYTVTGFAREYLDSLSDEELSNLDIIIDETYNDQFNDEAPITEIGAEAFMLSRYVKHYPSIRFGELILSTALALEIIGDRAFMGCKDIGAIYIPEKVYYIGQSAFEGCELAASLDWTSNTSLVTIGPMAFKGCKSMNSYLEFPNTVKSIGYSAFENCTGWSLTIRLPENSEFTTIENSAFRNCYNLAGDLVIPESVTVIEPYAFENCNFGSLKLPSRLRDIGSYAFAGCGFGGALTIPAVATIRTNAFAGCAGLKTIYLPGSSVDGETSYGIDVFEGVKGDIIAYSRWEYEGFTKGGHNLAKYAARLTYRTEVKFGENISQTKLYGRSLSYVLNDDDNVWAKSDDYVLPVDFKENCTFTGWKDWNGVEVTVDTVVLYGDNPSMVEYFAQFATELDSLRIEGSPVKTEYRAFDNFNVQGITVIAVFKDGTEKEIYRGDYDIVYANGGASFRYGESTVQIAYTDEGGITKSTTIEGLSVQKVKLNKPTLEGEYLYHGGEQTAYLKGFDENTMTVSGNTAVNAGTRFVEVGLTDVENYEWSDATVDNIRLLWVIAKLDYDMSKITFGGVAVKENGKAHKIEIEGELPNGVSVSYGGTNGYTADGAIAAGVYEVTAKFAVADSVNYNIPAAMTATLTINRTVLAQDKDENGSENVVIESEKGLAPDVKLSVKDVTDSNRNLDTGDIESEVKQVYDLSLEKEGAVVGDVGSLTVRLLIPQNLRGDENLKVYSVGADGKLTEVYARRDGEYMVFRTSVLSKFAIAGYKRPIIYFAATVALWSATLAGLLYIMIFSIVKRAKRRGKPAKGKKKEVKTYAFSVAPILLAIGLFSAMAAGAIALVFVIGLIIYMHTKDRAARKARKAAEAEALKAVKGKAHNAVEETTLKANEDEALNAVEEETFKAVDNETHIEETDDDTKSLADAETRIKKQKKNKKKKGKQKS